MKQDEANIELRFDQACGTTAWEYWTNMHMCCLATLKDGKEDDSCAFSLSRGSVRKSRNIAFGVMR